MPFKNIVAFFMLLFFLPIGVSAESGATGEEEKIVALMTELDRDQAALILLIEQTKTAEFVDRQALVFRQDDRSFNLLADADQLAIAASQLPMDSDLRTQVVNDLSERLRHADEAVMNRLNELDQLFDKHSAELDSLSASARVTTESYLQALDAIRFAYYKALIEHYKSRKLLGLPYQESKVKLRQMLYLYAEAQVGKIEFSTVALSDLRGRLKLGPDDADLLLAQSHMTVAQSEAVDKLKTAVQLLDHFDFDTSQYKAELLKQNRGLSVSMLRPSVFRTVLQERLGNAQVDFFERAPDMLLKLIVFIFILVSFRFLSRMARGVVRASINRSSVNMSVLLKDLLVSASSGSVMLVGILIALSQVGISVGPMLAGLGVAGFIFGFALQDTLGNFAAGAMILIYRPYDVDDFVEVTGASGLVKKMSLVSTTITTFDNQTLVIPNSKIWGDVIKNVTAQKVRRVDMTFGIGYRDDVEKAEAVLADIVTAHEMILRSPAPTIKLHKLGESSVDFVVRPWTKTEHYWDVYWDVTREVKMRFDREGISIPFPQRDVHLIADAGSD